MSQTLQLIHQFLKMIALFKLNLEIRLETEMIHVKKSHHKGIFHQNPHQKKFN